jgi:carboxypeptidase Taq
MQKDLPEMWSAVERGDFSAPLAWLRKHIHTQGHALEAPEIVRAAVGERDHVEDLLAYLWTRVGGLYGVKRAG